MCTRIFFLHHHRNLASTVESALNFTSGGLEVIHRTIFFFFLFVFKEEHIDQLEHVYANYSSHHHRSLASTVGSALNFISGGLEVIHRIWWSFFF